MKVFELAKKLNKKSKEILSAAEFLNIKVKSHLSTLNDEEIREIISYFRKRRFIFFFKKYLTPLLLIFLLTILFFIIYPQSVVSGEIDASVNEVGKLTLDWKINESIEEGAILIESESELLIVEIDESIGSVVECCFEEDLNIFLLLTDDNDEIIEVESVNLPLSNKSITTTSTSTTMTASTTTTTTIPECNDEDFQPYTLYDLEGNANTVLTCRNEQDALEAGFIYTVNPNPAEPNTTLAPTTTSTTSTTLGLLIDEIPTDDNVNESSSCKTVTQGTHIGKNKFQYQAVFTSDTKEYEYKLRFRFNGKKWKDWKRGNFKSIGGKKDRLKIRISKTAVNKKNAISSFEYEFTYRNKVGTLEKKTQKFAWEKDIPCAFIDPDNTTKSVNELQRRLNFTDDFNTITPSNTIPSITSSTTTTSTTTSSTTTSSTTTTIPEPTYIVYDRDCNEFGPYPINEYNEIIGDGSVYLGYCIIDVYATSTTTTTTTTIPEPPPQATPTTTTTTSTTTTTIPEPSYTATQSLGSCSGPSGTRTSTLTVTNDLSEARYFQYGYKIDDAAFVPRGITVLDPGSSITATQVVPDGSSIIWRVNYSINTAGMGGFYDYVNLSASDTVDCPDGYYVNVDGSNTYALTVECRKWNDTTKVRFRANPWWGDYDLAKDYMFALIALTGDYDNGNSSVDVEDYFDYSQFSCGVVPGAYFAYQKGFVQFIGQAITAPSWNSTTDVEDGSSNQKDFYIFSELVP